MKDRKKKKEDPLWEKKGTMNNYHIFVLKINSMEFNGQKITTPLALHLAFI